MLEMKAIQLRAVFDGVTSLKGVSFPCLIYSFISEGLSEQTRHISSAVEVRDSAQLQRLEQEFQPGDKIELTIRTDPHDPQLTTELIAFSKMEKTMPTKKSSTKTKSSKKSAAKASKKTPKRAAKKRSARSTSAPSLIVKVGETVGRVLGAATGTATSAAKRAIKAISPEEESSSSTK